MNRKIVRAARARFVEALYKRYSITGLRLGMDIARTISKRTGVPVAAIVVTPGQDSLTYGAAKIVAHKFRRLAARDASFDAVVRKPRPFVPSRKDIPALIEDLSIVSSLEVD
jgi:hypothetical protein